MNNDKEIIDQIDESLTWISESQEREDTVLIGVKDGHQRWVLRSKVSDPVIATEKAVTEAWQHGYETAKNYTK